MLKTLEKIYDRIKVIYGPRHFSALLLLLVIISALGLLVGIRYSSYIRNDPEYCNSCHLMKSTFDGWRVSDHKAVPCQQCHRLTVLEQNTLLVKYVIYGPEKVKQKHGRKLPWDSCAQCHWEERAQGSDRPEESYGHYRHNFLQCFNCHPFAGHNFPYRKGACERCHRGKRVHGEGMERIPCTSCHIFSQREGTEKNRVIPTRHRCMKCHNLYDEFPAAAPMAKLECFDCHDPHGAIKPPDKVCVACHEKDLHDNLHKANKLGCTSCHKAHTWKTSK